MTINLEKISFYEKTAKSSLIGASQTVVIFILTHPLDLLKTKLQADLTKSTSKQLIKSVYLNDGFTGFYKGGLPNYARSLTKEIYRSPLRGYFNKLYFDLLPNSVKSKHPDLKNALTGLTMSLTDSYISCPLERLKVWFMTNKEKKNLFYLFYKSNSSSLNFVKDLFRGLNVYFYRSTLSWVSYLVIEERIREFIFEKSPRKNKNIEKDLSILEQLIVGTLSGLTNSAITLPFDTAKTQIQKSGNSKNESLIRIINTIIRSKGFLGLYSGWQFRVPNYIIVAMITSINVQKIDKIWNKKFKSD